MNDTLNKWLELQAEIGVLKKDTVNPYHKSKYATLNQVLALVNPMCEKYGFVIFQDPVLVGEKLYLKTQLCMRSDGSLFRDNHLPLFGDRSQDLGASLTFMRRYALVVMFNLKAEDDDGNSDLDKDGLTKPQKEQQKVADVSYTKYMKELEVLEKGCSTLEFNSFRRRAFKDMFYDSWSTYQTGQIKTKVPKIAEKLGFELTADGKDYIEKHQQTHLEDFTK